MVGFDVTIAQSFRLTQTCELVHPRRGMDDVFTTHMHMHMHMHNTRSDTNLC